VNPDLINAFFEFFAAIVASLNVRQILKDKEVKGVSVWPVIFFITWGFWNLFYYPHLDQLWSSIGAVAMLSVNILWLFLVIKYRKESHVDNRN
jgi:membrane protein YdbS with pleckstrin-like domain